MDFIELESLQCQIASSGGFAASVEVQKRIEWTESNQAGDDEDYRNSAQDDCCQTRKVSGSDQNR